MRRVARFNSGEWLAKLRKLADEGRVHIPNHARKRMVERGITRIQAIRCLQQGNVSEGPMQETTGNVRATFEIVDSGDILRIVAEVYESGVSYVVVITAIRVG